MTLKTAKYMIQTLSDKHSFLNPFRFSVAGRSRSKANSHTKQLTFSHVFYIT